MIAVCVFCFYVLSRFPQNVDKITHHSKACHDYFINDWFLNQIPQHLRQPLCNLVTKFARTISNQRRYLNNYKHKCRERKHTLKIHGLLQHGGINPNKFDQSGQWRTLKHVKQCVTTLNSCVSDVIDLREKYLLDEFRQNPHVFNLVSPKLELIWFRQQNYLTNIESNNDEYGIRIALTGVINSWTQNQWNSFNRSV